MFLEVRPDLLAEGAPVEGDFADGDRDQLEVSFVLASGKIILFFFVGGALLYLLLHFVKVSDLIIN